MGKRFSASGRKFSEQFIGIFGIFFSKTGCTGNYGYFFQFDIKNKFFDKFVNFQKKKDSKLKKCTKFNFLKITFFDIFTKIQRK